MPVVRPRGDDSVPVVLVVTELLDLTGRTTSTTWCSTVPPRRHDSPGWSTASLYEAEAGEWACAQMVASALELYETEWLRRLDLELLSR
jgi:hypothetical protein